MLGAGWHPVGLAQPDHTVPWGQRPVPPPAELAMLAPGASCGSPRGVDGMPHPRSLPGLTLVSAIPEACRAAGRRAPAIGSASPGVQL